MLFNTIIEQIGNGYEVTIKPGFSPLGNRVHLRIAKNIFKAEKTITSKDLTEKELINQLKHMVIDFENKIS